MLRRVNLAFSSVSDEERWSHALKMRAIPFEAVSMVICVLDFLTHNSRYTQALAANGI